MVLCRGMKHIPDGAQLACLGQKDSAGHQITTARGVFIVLRCLRERIPKLESQALPHHALGVDGIHHSFDWSFHDVAVDEVDHRIAEATKSQGSR